MECPDAPEILSISIEDLTNRKGRFIEKFVKSKLNYIEASKRKKKKKVEVVFFFFFNINKLIICIINCFIFDIIIIT